MTTQKGKREEALEWARNYVEFYDAHPTILNVVAGSATLLCVARTLLSSSKAEGEMQEALKKAAGWFGDYAREHHEKAQRFEQLGMYTDANATRIKGGTNAARKYACLAALPKEASNGDL
jgi:hypothetical protein